MKKLLLTCLASLALVMSAQANNIPFPGILWNQQTTNLVYNAPVGATGTNTSAVFTNNVMSGVVLNANSNLFNLSPAYTLGVSGAQPITNLWPAVGFSMLAQYPNSYTPPGNNLTIVTSGALMVTNGTSTAITFKYAGSIDGVIWVTNYLQYTYTIAINSTTPGVVQTNITTGGMAYFALQEIDNPGANILSNVTVSASWKPGL